MSDLRLENIRKKLIGYDNESGMPFSRYVSRYRDEDNMLIFFEILTSSSLNHHPAHRFFQ